MGSPTCPTCGSRDPAVRPVRDCYAMHFGELFPCPDRFHTPTQPATADDAVEEARDEFEAWAASEGYYLDRDTIIKEEYENTPAQEAWVAWKASRAALRRANGGARG